MVPVIEAVKSRFDVPVSIDTYKGAVTEAALKAGADLVNDIWGFKHDKKVAELTAKYNATCCLMHNRHGAVYEDFLSELVTDMEECVRIAREAGVSDDRIILDPGDRIWKNLRNESGNDSSCGCAASSGIRLISWHVTKISKSDLRWIFRQNQRVEGTVVTTVIGVMKGCAFVRVHDIKENKRAIQMTEAILGR